MDHIVVRIQPFIYLQQIEVYKDGKCIDISESNMMNLDENISIKAKVHNIKNVDLAGDKHFIENIKKRLTQNKFNLDLKITLY